MRTIFLLFGVFMYSFGLAQLRPDAISLAYSGEMITHPGIRVGVEYRLGSWEKSKINRKGHEKIINRWMVLSPTLGFFYHRRNQTGIHVAPEFRFQRQNRMGSFFAYGVGLGYLQTFTPNTFEINEAGILQNTRAGHPYFASHYFLSFGKDLSVQKNIPFTYFVKPQFLYALPNFPNGLGYFFLELGIRYHLK